jgi:hypothetical protein
MQFYIEEFVEKMSEINTMSRKAFISFLRSYACYTKEWKAIFNLKNLHTGHVAKSFGLREAPNEIVGKEMKLFKGSKNSNSNTNKRFDTEKRDHFGSKHARDLKRLSNNHREYGNVAKKNKQRAQRADLDLSGLLRRHKSVDEFSSGFDSASNRTGHQRSGKSIQNKDKRSIGMAIVPSRNNSQSNGSSDNQLDGMKAKQKPKIIKKNMDIFD